MACFHLDKAFQFIVLAAVVAAFAAPPRAVLAQATDPRLTAEALYQTDRLVEIDIEMPPSSWDEMRMQTRSFVDSFRKQAADKPFTYFRADVTINGVRIPQVGVRKKGFFGSMDETRPSLKIKFDEYQSNRTLNLGDQGGLTLNNDKQDRSHASQILAYQLFRDAGLPAPRVGLAVVRVNGESLGVFANVEPIGESFLNSRFGNSNGTLVEGVFPTDFVADRLGRFEIKKTGSASPLPDLRHIAEILDHPGDDLLPKLEEYFEIDQFLKHWAMESLIAFWDGYAGNQNNFYLYKPSRGGKHQFIPWGADFAFSSQFQFGSQSVKARGLLAYHLNQLPAVRTRYQGKLDELLEKVWREVQLLAQVDQVEKLVKDRLHADQAGAGEAAEAIRAFVKGRREALAIETKDGPIHVTTPPGPLMYSVETGKLKATFTAPWMAKAPASALGAGQATLDLKLAAGAVPMKEFGAYATAGSMFQFGPPRPGPQPPMLVIAGKRQADDTQLAVIVPFTAAQFVARKDPLIAQGFVMEPGKPPGPGMMSFYGKVTLEKTSTTEGETVVGVLDGGIYEMRGGFGAPPPPADRASDRRP